MPYIVDKTAVPPEPERVRSGELWAPDWAVAHALTNGETVQTKLYGQPTHRDGLTRLYTHEDMAAAVPPELGSIPVGALTCGEEALLRAWAAAYAAAAVAAERERCAKVCEDIGDAYQAKEAFKWAELKTDAQTGAHDCAEAIRKGHA